MAYDRNRIIIFGGAGIAIAVLLITFFLPVETETHVATSVTLQEIPGYGFQTVKISEGQADVIHLNLTLGGFEIRGTDGEWTGISVPETVSLNLLRNPETFITADASGIAPGSYTAVRFQILGGLEYANATLTNEEVVSVDTPFFKVEYAVEEFEVDESTENLSVNLIRGPGQLANYMLPGYHISTGTMKIMVSVIPN
jgi:hypothetical protein